MRVWTQEPLHTVTNVMDVDNLLRSPRISIALAKELIRELGEVVFEFRDYEETVGLMNPATRRAVCLLRNYPRYAATEGDAQRLLSYLKMPSDGGEDDVVVTALITSAGAEEMPRG